MAAAVITGSAGLIVSEAVRHSAGAGLDVVGIDMRRVFVGDDSSTASMADVMVQEYGRYFAVLSWTLNDDVPAILGEMHDANRDRWTSAAG